MQHFGEKLRTLRKQHRLTLRQLAPMLDVQYSFVGKIERGEQIPHATLILKIADLFNVSTDQLMRDDLELE
jgi:transcriptional regulator with XRE-family HTH domain